MPEPTIREQVATALSDAVLDNAIYQSCPAPLCTLSILRDELMAALTPILELVERTETMRPISVAREQRMKATEAAMRAEYERRQAGTFASEVETVLRETRLLRFGAPGRSPLAPVEVHDLMAALSPLLERVERQLKETTMYTSEFDRLKAQKDAIEAKQESARFESELRRRVEGLSYEMLTELYDSLAISHGESRQFLLTALLAPPATPETERE